MDRCEALPLRLMPAAAGVVLGGLVCGPAAAQFSPRESYTPDGAYRFSVELTPYLFLPAVDASIGLGSPFANGIGSRVSAAAAPAQSASVNQGVPSIAKVLESLHMAFIGDGLVRYGPYSVELDVQYVSAFDKRTLPPGPEGRTPTLKTDVSMVRLTPGIGYQVLPTDAASRFTLDVRAGVQYLGADVTSGIQNSPFPELSRSISDLQPWLGLRGVYYASPDWRITSDLAATGFGVNGGDWGWNGKLGVSYLITRWFDVSGGVFAMQTNQPEGAGLLNAPHALHLLTWGPEIAVGFRF